MLRSAQSTRSTRNTVLLCSSSLRPSPARTYLTHTPTYAFPLLPPCWRTAGGQLQTPKPRECTQGMRGYSRLQGRRCPWQPGARCWTGPAAAGSRGGEPSATCATPEKTVSAETGFASARDGLGNSPPNYGSHCCLVRVEQMEDQPLHDLICERPPCRRSSKREARAGVHTGGDKPSGMNKRRRSG